MSNDKRAASQRPINRRDFLKLGAAMAALSACQRIPGDTALVDTAPQTLATAPAQPKAATAQPRSAPPTPAGLAWLAANRIQFGPRPGDIEHISKIGVDAFIDAQIASDAIDDSALASRLASHDLSMLDRTPQELAEGRQVRLVRNQLSQATVLRAVYSERQLYELMVDFWTNHFNIFFQAGTTRFLKAQDDRDVIRAHALGRFGDLLEASASSPAMLDYLDNAANKRGAPNENYARELMELHTIGVAGGYTQQDVAEAARALTGWSIVPARAKKGNPGTFVFRKPVHDDDAKTILGLKIPAGGGQRDGEMLLTLLAKHPNCAQFISLKLARRFVADDPPKSVVEAGAAAFAKSNGDIKATLGAILHSDAFKQSSGKKLKRPFDYVVSALRVTDADTDGGEVVNAALTRMGQPLFMWSSPDGYPDNATAWLGAGSMLARWNFALSLSTNTLRGTRTAAETYASAAVAAQAVLGAALPKTALTALEPHFASGNSGAATGLLLASPLFHIRG